MIPLLLRLTILLAFAWLGTALLRRRPASLRHVIWMVAICGSLLLPIADWAIPKGVIAGSTIFVSTAPVLVRSTAEKGLLLAAVHWLPLIWAAGTCFLLARFLIGRLRTARITKSARSTASYNGIPVRISSQVRGPVVSGIYRNAILLPRSAEEWAAETKRSVLAHEAEHVLRRDGLTLAIADIARAIYWFHPLIWLAFSKMRQESEKSCDDAAIRLGLRPSSYAGLLLQLARAFPSQPAFASNWMPMATTSHLENRMKAILDPTCNRSAARKGTWAAATVAGIGMLALLSSVSLVSLEARTPQAAAPQQAGPHPIRVGGNVQQANLITKVNPVYPPAAKQRGAQGTVSLTVHISKEGVPEDIQAMPSDVDGELVGAAIDAVRQWRYKATLLNGEPVEVITTIDVNFTLAQ